MANDDQKSSPDEMKILSQVEKAISGENVSERDILLGIEKITDIKLDPLTSFLFNNLCSRFGYYLSKQGNRANNRSRVIAHCIRHALGTQLSELEDNPTNLELTHVSNVVKFLQAKETNGSPMYTTEQIADILTENKIERPDAILGLHNRRSSKKWTEDDIKNITNFDWLLDTMLHSCRKYRHDQQAAEDGKTYLPDMNLPLVRERSEDHTKLKAVNMLQTIAEYQRDALGATSSEIARFMSKEGFPKPDKFLTPLLSTNERWIEDDVEFLLNDDRVRGCL